MAKKLNVEEFVAALRKSGLVDASRLDELLREYWANGGNPNDPLPLAILLNAANLLTKWQTEKLLQGKHRGFFIGRYKILSLIGKGGMSSVYLAEHLLMRRLCALKVLPANRVDDSSYLERFHREAQAVASLDHLNIVRAYDVDHENDGNRSIHFLVMEYVEGTSLHDMATEKGQFSLLDAAEYARQTANGLQHAHDNGMVHRDIKPGNLLVDRQGIVKILDLGLARFFQTDEGKGAITIRHDEKVLGTADYLAPEQALDSHSVDTRADIYSLGCTLYFLLTGHPPFKDGTVAQRLLAHQMKSPPCIQSERQDIPDALANIVRRMMEKRPDDRYATAAETAKALYDWIKENADAEWRSQHAADYGSPRSGSSRRILPVAIPVSAQSTVEISDHSYRPDSEMPNSSHSNLLGHSSENPIGPDDIALNQFLSKLTQSDFAMSYGKSESNPEETSSIISSEYRLSAERSAPRIVAQPNLSSTHPGALSGIGRDQFVDKAISTGKKTSGSQRASQINSLTKLRWKVIGKSAGIATFIVFILLAAAYSIDLFHNFEFGNGNQAVVPPFPNDKRELTVGGPNADFSGIREALIAVRNRYRPDVSNPNERFIVRIREGTYHDRIRIDGRNRHWPDGIVLRGEGEVILESSDDGPVIRLANVTRFTIENILIDARGKSVAMELAEDLHDTHLNNIAFRGYSEVGVLCTGVQGLSFGNRQLVLEHLKFEPGSSQSTGIRLEEGIEYDARHIIIRECQFSRPMASGVTLRGNAPNGISISRSIFSETSDGIRIDGQPMLKMVQFTNNTFHGTKTGIRFSKFPNELSSAIAFRRNLFVETEIAEVVVQEGFDEAKFRSILAPDRVGIENNWSDRPKSESAIEGEVGLIFENEGRQGPQDFAFGSLDANNPQFLAPTKNSPQRDVPGAQLIDKKWVGAIGP